ncbi:hypothetical protein FH972_027113 [Carpinus fangiana]|uniref:Uncharacterized protein n=1 Tax=Carpinus fangiana TaxID=176857 RepID=A0A5N6L678_9ROSI|nr:hypothetical protein FH972_027113 [Carpinus fangiana]
MEDRLLMEGFNLALNYTSTLQPLSNRKQRFPYHIRASLSDRRCMSSCSSMSVWVAFDGAALGVVGLCVSLLALEKIKGKSEYYGGGILVYCVVVVLPWVCSSKAKKLLWRSQLSRLQTAELMGKIRR